MFFFLLWKFKQNQTKMQNIEQNTAADFRVIIFFILWPLVQNFEKYHV